MTRSPGLTLLGPALKERMQGAMTALEAVAAVGDLGDTAVGPAVAGRGLGVAGGLVGVMAAGDGVGNVELGFGVVGRAAATVLCMGLVVELPGSVHAPSNRAATRAKQAVWHPGPGFLDVVFTS